MIQEAVSVGIHMICTLDHWMYALCLYIYISYIVLMLIHPNYIPSIFPFKPIIMDKSQFQMARSPFHLSFMMVTSPLMMAKQ